MNALVASVAGPFEDVLKDVVVKSLEMSGIIGFFWSESGLDFKDASRNWGCFADFKVAMISRAELIFERKAVGERVPGHVYRDATKASIRCPSSATSISPEI